MPTAEEEARWPQWFEKIGGQIADPGNRVGQVPQRRRPDRPDVLACYIVISAGSMDAAMALEDGCCSILLTDRRPPPGQYRRRRPPGPAPDQDRSLWDRSAITEGLDLVRQSLRRSRPRRWTQMAAIAAVHAESPT